MTKLSILTTTLAIGLLTACATAPEKIVPQYVSQTQYNSLNCEQLGVELDRSEDALSQASAQQKKARTNDTVGVIFLGLPVSSLSGSNQASYIAKLKGKIEAMNQVSQKKSALSNNSYLKPPQNPLIPAKAGIQFLSKMCELHSPFICWIPSRSWV